MSTVVSSVVPRCDCDAVSHHITARPLPPSLELREQEKRPADLTVSLMKITWSSLETPPMAQVARSRVSSMFSGENYLVLYTVREKKNEKAVTTINISLVV